MFRIVIAAFAAAAALFSLAHAAIITATISALGGDVYQAEFAITNNSLGQPIEEFTIYFDVGNYLNLSIISSPADWDGIAIQPDPGIPADGFADWLALGMPLNVNQLLAGFIVQFAYVGAGAPGGWFFEVVDPATFAALESGFVSEVPIPAAFWLFASIFACAFMRRSISSQSR